MLWNPAAKRTLSGTHRHICPRDKLAVPKNIWYTDGLPKQNIPFIPAWNLLSAGLQHCSNEPPLTKQKKPDAKCWTTQQSSRNPNLALRVLLTYQQQLPGTLQSNIKQCPKRRKGGTSGKALDFENALRQIWKRALNTEICIPDSVLLHHFPLLGKTIPPPPSNI